MCPLHPAGVGPPHESFFCDAQAIQSRKGGVMHKGWKDAPIWPRGTKKGGEICTVPLSTGSKVAPSIAGCTNSHNAIFVVWRAQWLSVHSNFPDYHRAQFENSGTKCFSHARAYNAWWIGEGSVSWQVPFNFFPSPNCGCRRRPRELMNCFRWRFLPG